ADIDGGGGHQVVFRPTSGEERMTHQSQARQFHEEIGQAGDESVRGPGLELPAQGEQVGDIGRGGQRYGDGGLAASHEVFGGGAAERSEGNARPGGADGMLAGAWRLRALWANAAGRAGVAGGGGQVDVL